MRLGRSRNGIYQQHPVADETHACYRAEELEEICREGFPISSKKTA